MSGNAVRGNGRGPGWGVLSLAGAVLALDQLTKWAVVTRLEPNRSVSVLGDVLRLTRVHNPGGAFGLLPDHTHVLLGVSVAVTLIVGWMLWRSRLSWIPRSGLTLLWAGTVGNLIDRVRWGYVLDFIQVPYFPVFNVADSAIVLGAVVIAWKTVVSGR